MIGRMSFTRWLTIFGPLLATCVLTILVGVFLLVAFYMIPPENRHKAFIGAVETGIISALIKPSWLYVSIAAVIIVRMCLDYQMGKWMISKGDKL